MKVINEKDAFIITGVHSTKDINWDAVFGMLSYTTYDVSIAKIKTELHDSIHSLLKDEFPDIMEDLFDVMDDSAWYDGEDNSEVRCYGYELVGAELFPKGPLQFIINNNEGTIQVAKSTYAISCGRCSPCYPGQGDVSSNTGRGLAYCLPPSMWAEDMDEQEKKEMLSRVYFVKEEADGELGTNGTPAE